VLDAGNVFGSSGLQAQIKAEVAVEGMSMMSYDMFNLGSEDFNFGTEFLLEYTGKFNVPTINANIVYEDTGENITSPYKIVKFGNLKVGFIGIVSKEYEDEILQSNSDNSREIIVLDEQDVLQTQIEKIKDEVDIIILLANVGMKKSITIAEQTEGIDVIICGHGDDETDRPYWINGVYIVKAGHEGKTIGNLVLRLGVNKNLYSVEGSIITLDSSFSDDEQLKALMDEYHDRLEEYKDELLDVEQQDPDTGLYYVGLSKCSECHPSEASTWNDTAHAGAFDSLVESGQEYNKECITCHTTGFGYTGGFTAPGETPEMEGVQCEMCHGAGGEHVETGKITFGAVSEATCVKCHTTENSPGFDYNTYYPAIEH
jgi:hypothetical protein